MEKEEKEEELENEKLNDFYFQYSSSLSETSIKSTESAEAEEKLFSDLNNLDLEFGSIVFDY